MRYSLPIGTRFISPLLEDTQEKDEPVKIPEMLLMYFLLMLTGNPFFTTWYDLIVMLSAVVTFYYMYKNSRKPISYRTIFIFVFLLGYEIMHSYVYQLDYSKTIIKLTLVLLLGFSVVHLLRDKFIRVLIDTMIIISIVSWVFTALCYVPKLNWFLYDLALELFPMPLDVNKDYIPRTLLVYTFHPQFFEGHFTYARNAGIFWESGAFAVFLNISLYLRYITKKIVVVKDLFDKKSLILIITVLSTTSTMGFLTLVVLLTFFTLKLRTRVKFLFLAMILPLFYVAFINVEYLGSKVSKQLEESSQTNNRFGAALMDWEDIKKRPFIGSSRRIKVIFNTQQRTKDTRRPNGLTNFLRDYGIIYFSFYFYLVFRSFNQIFYSYHGYTRPWTAFFGVFLLWLMAFSELLFDLPFFKALIFLSMVYFPITAHEEEEALTENQLQSV
jgi:hypothetical protein